VKRELEEIENTPSADPNKRVSLGRTKQICCLEAKKLAEMDGKADQAAELGHSNATVAQKRTMALS